MPTPEQIFSHGLQILLDTFFGFLISVFWAVIIFGWVGLGLALMYVFSVYERENPLRWNGRYFDNSWARIEKKKRK